MENSIKIKGARAHNLKNIDVEIPRDKLVVITGLSGSGKSSLAFDTIYAEGQRRYVESLSSYARQFLGQMDKPDVDNIDGLSPAISIDQKTTSHNPRSTVGTVTEIYDYLRLLFARVGRPHCPKCGKPIAQQTVDQMIDQIQTLPERTKLLIMAQVVRGKKGSDGSQIIEVPKELLKAGKIDLTVSLRDGMKLLKKWVVSPLLISEYDEDLAVSDFLKNIEDKITRLEARVKTLEEKSKDYCKSKCE